MHVRQLVRHELHLIRSALVLITVLVVVLLGLLAVFWGCIAEPLKLLAAMQEQRAGLMLLWIAPGFFGIFFGVAAGRAAVARVFFAHAENASLEHNGASALVPVVVVLVFLAIIGGFLIGLSRPQEILLYALIHGINAGFDVLLALHGFLTFQYIAAWVVWWQATRGGA